MFARLGRFAYRRRGRVVIAWVIGLVVLGGIAGAVGSGFSTKFGLPNGVESKRGLDLLDLDGLLAELKSLYLVRIAALRSA